MLKHCKTCSAQIPKTRGARQYCKACSVVRRRQTKREYHVRRRLGSGKPLSEDRPKKPTKLTLIDTGMKVHDQTHLLLHPDGKCEPAPPDFGLKYHFGSVGRDGFMKVYRAWERAA